MASCSSRSRSWFSSARLTPTRRRAKNLNLAIAPSGESLLGAKSSTDAPGLSFLSGFCGFRPSCRNIRWDVSIHAQASDGGGFGAAKR